MLTHCYASNMDTVRPPLGALLRTWRNKRRLSQLGLALEAGMSARHLSFIETGRARPSREMLLRLADCLQIPPRPCNDVLLAAGRDAPDGTHAAGHSPIATPLRLRTELGKLAFLSTTMVFDYPLDINVSELLIEVFLPADAATAAALAQTPASR